MTLGGVVWLFAYLLPAMLAPSPGGVVTAGLIMQWAGPLLLAAGGCIYARGIGQPVWLGLFSVVLVGFVMLLWLPDLRPDPEDDDSL